MTATTVHGKRSSVGSARSASSSGIGGGSTGGGGGGRARHIDPSLMMSTKEGQNENKHLGGHAHIRNKSSDRLHRIGGGSSSTNLSHSKRSKSYSQIMNATAQPSSGGGKSKTRRGKSEGQSHVNAANEEDDEGWTSADQTTTSDVDASVDSKDQSDDEADEGLVFGKKKEKGKAKAKNHTTPKQGFQVLAEPAKTTDQHDQTPSSPSTAQAEKTPLARPVEPIDDEPTTLITPQSQKMEDHIPQSPGQHNRKSYEETLAIPPTASTSPEQLTGDPVLKPSLTRHDSMASAHTLMGDNSSMIKDSSSPRSTRSARKRLSLLPRESSVYAAPPQLSTEYAFAGGRLRNNEKGDLGNNREYRQNDVSHRVSDPNLGAGMAKSPNDRTSDSMPQYRFSTTDTSLYERRRKSSVSSSRSSFINLPGVAPSLGTISHDSANAQSTGVQTSRALEAMQRASIGAANYVASQSAFSLPHDRDKGRRVRSFEASSGVGGIDNGGGTGTAEAARLANKLRMTRGDSMDDGKRNTNISSSASRLLASSGSKYFTSSNRTDGPTAKSLAQYKKPTISVFVNRQDDFKSVEKVVERGNLFDENFTRASLGGGGGGLENESGHNQSALAKQSGEDVSSDAKFVRYVMDFGLSGPSIQKTPTTQALLSTCIDNDEFESSWAPALTHAAGLGDSGSHGRIGSGNHYGAGTMNEGMEMGGAGGIFINGPNATPLHFLHGLTNTNDNPFPLDETDMNVGAMNDDGAMIGGIHEGIRGEYVDAKNLRAIALTWAALNATKNHIVTRRYVDPMRESLERVSLAGGMKINSDSPSGGQNTGLTGSGSLNPVGGGIHGNSYMNAGGHSSNTGASGMMTPGGNTLKWGWRHLFPEHGLRE